MNKFHSAALSCLLLITAVLHSRCQPESVPAAPPADPDWKLVWADEFDQPGLPDSTKWNYDAGGHGWGNNEWQFYTNKRTENARVENGRLLVEARQEAFGGKDYTSARLVSKGKGDWTYGRFEVKAKLPSGRGTWPAIWMLATKQSYGSQYWPDNGEIDVMEHVGYNPDSVHASVHCRAYFHSIGTQRTARRFVPTARTADHVYAIEWTPERVEAFIDGQKYFSFANDGKKDYRTWPFNQPFHLLLNLAVGGNWGGAKGVDPAIWPQRMEVDYVRVYQRK
ncbi:MAG: glycoside hydrolase family 16 protein [Ferruginibacter sp.]|nr:glycoside hydrolase family 16 protein [Cytophagales bacterium]